MKKVLFRGPTLTQSGYGVHARQIARWLLGQSDIDVNFMVTPWGDTPWILDKNLQDGLIGRIMEKTVSSDYKADLSIQLQLPNEWDPKLAAKNIGVTASVESDKASFEWLKACNEMNAVIFPSEHAKSSISANGEIKVPNYIVPESYADAIAKDSNIELLNVDTNFNFLVFGQLTGNNPYNDRKNILFTLKWLFEAFKDDPEVGIVLKTNSGRNTKIDRDLVLKVLNSVVEEARKGPYPKVHFLHGEMNDKEISGLYRHPSIKALVSLTRGEGFGLPILEAAATGLPIIATNWSAHTEFLKQVKFINVDYKLIPVHSSRVDGRIFVQGSNWAEPNESDFKKKVTKFRSSSSVPRSWAQEGSKIIQEKYSFASIARHYDDVLRPYFV